MNKPTDDRAVNVPATAAQPAPQSGRPAWPPVDNSHATTAPVPAARHHAPTRPARWPAAQPVPTPAPTAQFGRASAAPSRPGVYSPPAAYSATPYPAAHSHPAATYPQAYPGLPHPPGSTHENRPPQPNPAGHRGPLPQSPRPNYRQAEIEPGAMRMTTTTQRPHRRVDTSVLCAAAALILLALAVLVGLML